MRRILFVLVALALAVRLAVVAASPGFVPEHDAADYDRIAAVIAAAGHFPPTTFAAPDTPTALRPPAWPAALGATYALTGARWTAGRALAAGLGALTVGLLALLALELWGRRAAIAAGAIGAVAPPLVVASASLLSESLFVPLVLGAVLAGLRARGRIAPLAVAGAVAGLATLTRTAGVLLVALLAAAAWRQARLRGTAVVVAAAALVLAPWAVRNLTSFERPVLLTTQGGFTQAGTWNARSLEAPSPYTGAWLVPVDPTRRPAVDESVVTARLGAAARDFAAEHPGYVLRTAATNVLRLHHLAGHHWLTRLSFDEMGVPPRLDGLLVVSRWLLLFGGAAAVASLLRRRVLGPAWLWAVPVGFVLATVPWLGNPRYGLATDPFLVLALAGAIGYGPSVPKRNER